MSTQIPASTLDGIPVVEAHIEIPWCGRWIAEVALDRAKDMSGQVTIQFGGQSLIGTVVSSGTYALTSKAKIVGGYNGWSTTIKEKHYRSPVGVKAKTILEDAARECGEQIGDATYTKERVGAFWTRESGPASRVLYLVAGEHWWTAYDGKTCIGERPDSTPGKYDLIAYNPGVQRVTISSEDFGVIQVGATLPQFRVRHLTATLKGAAFRIHCWG